MLVWEKCRFWWNQIQDFLDVKGDMIMLGFTGAIVYRILYGPPLNMSEASVYVSAIGSFAYSKVGKYKP